MRKNERPMSAVAPPANGRHESPAINANHSASPSLTGAEVLRSTASSPLFGTEPLPEDDHSHCPYCHKNYRKPRVLDCLHSMCEDCIIAQLDGRLQQKSAAAEEKARKNTLDCELEAPKVTERPTPPGVIRCPTCAQESHVGNDVRYVHAMLLDFVRVAEMEESQNSTADRRCRACKTEQQAVAVCKQCQSDLCSNCVYAHGLMKLFDGHIVTSYEEMESRGSQPETRPVLCPAHGQPTRYLCAICESMACKQCLDSEHINHKVIEVNELVTNTIMEDVGNHADKMERKWALTMDELSNLPDRSAQLYEQYETARGRLEAYFDELIKAIEDSKQKKLVELDEARQRQEHNIDDLYRKMQVNEARIHDALTFTRRLLAKANGAEMVASRRKVVQQLGNLSHAIPSHGHQVELEFQPLARKQMDQYLGSLGGNVVGRMIQPTVKDVAPIGSEIAPSRVFQPQAPVLQPIQAPQPIVQAQQPQVQQQVQPIPQQQQQQATEDWGRALYSASSTSNNVALGAIGGERKKNQAAAAAAAANGSNGNRNGPSAGEAFGWPPSSIPPELSNSPPPQQTPAQQQQQATVQQIVQLQQQQQQLQSAVASTVASTLPLMGAAPVTGGGNGSQSTIPNIGNMNNAALRPDLAELVALANAGQLSLNSTPSLGTSVFSNVLWPQPSLNGLSTNAAAAAVAAAGGLATNANVQNLQAKIAQAQVQMMFSNQNRNLLNGNLLAMANLRNAPIDQLLGLSALSLGGATPHNLGADLVQGVTANGMGQRGNEIKNHRNADRQDNSSFVICSVFGTSQQGSSIRELHCPSGFCLSETDDILIADTNNHRVVVCGPPHPWKIGRPGTDDGQLCFPRKVISLKGESARYVVLDKGGDGKTRAQIFEGRGEFVKRINMLALVPRGGIEVSAAAATPNGQLLLVDTAGVVYSIDVDTPRVTFWFDASAHLGEASDVSMFENNIYITDFKHHCVQVFNSEGKFLRKMGEPSQTPYPIGIDITRNGEVLVADTHGNHLHVVVFNAEGQHQHSFTHNEFRLSRCVGLRIAKSGHVVTLCKHNHTLFVFKPLVLPNGVPVPATNGPITSSLINKFP